MDTSIIVALVSLCGTLFGSLFGVVASSRLTSYRLQELEEKIKKHNEVISRTYALEQRVSDMAEEIKRIQQI